MSIAPNPRRNTAPPEQERKAEAFIAKAANSPQVAPDEDTTLKPLMIRFPRHILKRVDQEAKKLGITRTAFIVQSTAEKIGKLEREDRS